MSLTANQFLGKLEEKFETLYQVSEDVTRSYFASNPSKENLMDHFKLRMMNERWNMVEFAKKVAELPVETSATECMLLSKQIYDEANHYRLVKEVLEHLNDGPIDVISADKSHGQKDSAKGVTLIDRYEAQDDPLIMALYQFLGEGRAARVWQTMSECIQDDFISTRYGKIARDEKFHSNIGKLKLSELATTPEAQAKVLEVANNMCWDLYEVACLNTYAPSETAKTRMREAYGTPTRELALATI
jgi:hypothetical protein